jgi:hypothetical protein
LDNFLNSQTPNTRKRTKIQSQLLEKAFEGGVAPVQDEISKRSKKAEKPKLSISNGNKNHFEVIHPKPHQEQISLNSLTNTITPPAHLESYLDFVHQHILFEMKREVLCWMQKINSENKQEDFCGDAIRKIVKLESKVE